jgi:hypothetical protein
VAPKKRPRRRWGASRGPFAGHGNGGAFLYPAVRLIAVPVSVDPLGSRAMGLSVFPEIFLGSLAIRPVPTGFAKRRVAWLPTCIPPRASANVLGRANATASTIVVTFMVVSFRG